MATVISASLVKELRERTGSGMMECKKALEETNGDIEKAIDALRAKGAAKAAKRSERDAKEGTIATYVHGGKIGVLVEVNCETDFVARNADFVQLARDIAMHVAAANPLALNAADIPADVVEREKAVYLETVKGEGKPEKMWDKIVEGKLAKFYKESTLLDQPYVKDPDKTVGEYVTEVASKTGENVVVRRFVRFALGE
ncbi:MAG TPA: translation elongation factor Ts [Longimicrobiales bacterium]|nr:translation elongation factor Ts [Longimicrobiales bacterium]